MNMEQLRAEVEHGQKMAEEAFETVRKTGEQPGPVFYSGKLQAYRHVLDLIEDDKWEKKAWELVT